MKKFLVILLSVLLVFSFAACRTDTNHPDNGNGNTDEIDGSKVLVVYFSASGNTEKVAKYISEATNGTLFELQPVQPYTSADLSWTTAGSRVNREHDDESLRDIELQSTTVENWSEYTTVFIGYPIWWGIAAWPVNNFVKNNNFEGKTVIPFATSSSSPLGQSGTLLQQMTNGGNWLGGQRFSSSANKSAVESWVKELGLNK